MQEFCQLQKSPQKNSISIRQNDNTLIITYFLYSHFYHIKWDFWVFRGFAISRNTQFPQYSHAISRVRQRYSKPSENEELSSAYLQVKRSINDVCQKDHLRFLRF